MSQRALARFMIIFGALGLFYQAGLFVTDNDPHVGFVFMGIWQLITGVQILRKTDESEW